MAARRRELDSHAQCLEHGEDLPKLAGGFAFFEITDEPQASAGGHGQVLLGHAHAFASALNELANDFRSVSHHFSRILPCGNIATKSHEIKHNIPEREHTGVSIPKTVDLFPIGATGAPDSPH